MTAAFDLERFVDAQQRVIGQVYRELRAGRKQSHWMWFVFPQLAGLGHSAMAQRYAIASLAEARAFLDHPVLGARLVELTEIVSQVGEKSVDQIFGSPDDMKFHSSMTLFAAANPETAAFQRALDRFFGGNPDRLTIDRLGLG